MIKGMVMYIWFVWGIQLLYVRHYREMLGDRGARMEYCLRRLLVLVLHLILGLVQA